MRSRSGLVVVVALSSCQDPTELKFVVSTDFDCALLSGGVVSARLGASFAPTGPATTTSQACANKSVGTLVVTPSGNGSRVTVEAIAAVAPASLDGDGNCGEGTAGCIHARRSLNFVSHRPLTIPMLLSQACAGVVCPADQTCVSGGCVPNAIDGNDCTTTDCTLPPPDGGVIDAGPPAFVNACGSKFLLASAPVPMVGVCPDLRGYEAVAAPTSMPKGMPVTLPIPTGLGQPTRVVIDGSHRAFVATTTGAIQSVHLDTKTLGSYLAAKQPAKRDAPLLIGADGTLHTSDGSNVITVDPATMMPMGAPVSLAGGIGSGFNVTESGYLVFESAGSGSGSTDATVGAIPLDGSTPPPLLVVTKSSPSGTATPLVANGLIWASDGAGFIAPFDATTLAPMGNAQMYGFSPAQVTSTAGAPDGVRVLWFSPMTNGYHVATIDAASTSAKSTSPAIQRDATSQIVAVTPGPTTWVSNASGFLLAFDANLSAPIYDSMTTVEAIYPAFDKDGNVLSAASDGALALFDSTHAMTLWKYAAPMGTIYAVAIDTDGTIIVTDKTNRQVIIYPP